MVEMGVIIKQEEPTPVVSNLIVVRKNNKIRLCIDPTDVNKNILRRHYPLRTMEEIAARIRNAKWFIILDCKKVFWQVKVAKNSQKYLTFGTPWGRYSCLRLPFGLSSAPEVFQNMISTLLEGIDGTDVSMEDILIYADTLEKLNVITAKVVDQLRSAGLKLNPEKCLFAKKSVHYLDHVVSELKRPTSGWRENRSDSEIEATGKQEATPAATGNGDIPRKIHRQPVPNYSSIEAAVTKRCCVALGT